MDAMMQCLQSKKWKFSPYFRVPNWGCYNQLAYSPKHSFLGVRPADRDLGGCPLLAPGSTSSRAALRGEIRLDLRQHGNLGTHPGARRELAESLLLLPGHDRAAQNVRGTRAVRCFGPDRTTRRRRSAPTSRARGHCHLRCGPRHLLVRSRYGLVAHWGPANNRSIWINKRRCQTSGAEEGEA